MNCFSKDGSVPHTRCSKTRRLITVNSLNLRTSRITKFRVWKIARLPYNIFRISYNQNTSASKTLLQQVWETTLLQLIGQICSESMRYKPEFNIAYKWKNIYEGFKFKSKLMFENNAINATHKLPPRIFFLLWHLCCTFFLLPSFL